MLWARLLLVALVVHGQETLTVLFENIGKLPVALDLLEKLPDGEDYREHCQNEAEMVDFCYIPPNHSLCFGRCGDAKRMVVLAPGQGAKLDTLKGQRYRCSSPNLPAAFVVIRDQGHVRCWAEEREVRLYPLWGAEVLRGESVATPDLRLMRQEKFDVVFENRGTDIIELTLRLADSVATPQGVIQPRKGRTVRAYWGQVFELLLVDDTRWPLQVTVEGQGTVRIHDLDDGQSGGGLRVTNSWAPLEESGLDRSWLAHASASRTSCNDALSGHEADASHFCDGQFDARFSNWVSYAESQQGALRDEWRQKGAEETTQRLQRQQAQPRRFKKRFTAAGHDLRAVPDDILRPLQEIWRDRRLNESLPELHGSETLARSDTWMLHLPDDLLDEIHKKLRPAVEQWAGLKTGQLVPTDAYGARLYRQGSSLNLHVESAIRAALSVIIEVGHLEFGSDGKELPSWPLHILDHEGLQHEVPIRVGQMIFYESATCAYGRLSTFKGREVANVVLHYNPIDWPRAYEVASHSHGDARTKMDEL